MSTATLSPDSTSLAPLAAALRADDLVAAEQLAAGAGPAGLRTLADSLMRCRRWRDTVWLLERVPDRVLAEDVKLRLSRNLGALQTHRPRIYDLLVDLPDDERFGIAPSPAGPLTVLARRTDGTAVSLATAADPAAGAAAAAASLIDHAGAERSLAICGAGDGYVLARLAAGRVEGFLGMEQALFLLEPEARILLLCLMIHDFTGPLGPIEQDRVRWFAGPNWADDLAAAVEADPCLGLPATSIAQGPRGLEARATLKALTERVIDADKHVHEALESYYDRLTPAELAGVIAGRAGRRPRVLLITTRFSTVLQYSTRDTARAFEQAGWDARIAIEPSPSHRLYQPAIRRLVHEFRPDLVFQIDHLRHEHNGLFPAGLPFVCWIQDHLAALKSESAGAQVGPRDFVLTDASSTYTRTFGYPRSQLLPMPKLTAIGAAPTAARADDGPYDHDIGFVSNASTTPAALLATAVDREFAGDPVARHIAVGVGGAIADVYASGGHVSTYAEVVERVNEFCAASSVSCSTETSQHVCHWLCHPFNDALYRQQALRWAAAAAREHGWRLSLFGTGWERNPEFAEFARGPVAYGPDLESLTRRTRVNLQVVPYLCLHQRLLDGLSAGGFFLARAHVCDVAPQAMSDLLYSHFPDSARTLDAARAVAPPPVRDRFESLVAACRNSLCPTGAEDPIEMVRDFEAASLLVPGGGAVLPHFDQTSFASARELTDGLRRYLAAPAERRQVAAAQRESVAARLSYAAGVRRVGRFVAEGLSRIAGTATPTPVAGRASAGGRAA